MALAAGTELGPYRIVALIGSGGMGEVYRALDPRLGREVAIKVLHGAARSRGAGPLRARSRAVAALAHPNALAVFDVGEENGVPYLVTELLYRRHASERGSARRCRPTRRCRSFVRSPPR